MEWPCEHCGVFHMGWCYFEFYGPIWTILGVTGPLKSEKGLVSLISMLNLIAKSFPGRHGHVRDKVTYGTTFLFMHCS